MTRSLERIQRWYAANCDGAWEHKYGVRIETLDNPGWAVEIDLEGTVAFDKELEEINLERGDGDWVRCRKKHLTLEAFCGPENLREVLNLVADWLDRK